jgi:aspartate racemase
MAKKIGILGGMSPESTAHYYKLIIGKYQERKSDLRYPEIIIYSLSFGELMQMKDTGSNESVVKMLANGIVSLKNAGAEFALISANTPHYFLKEVEKLSPLHIISIVKVTLEAAKDSGLKRLLLMGTKLTMESDFYAAEALSLGLEIVVPNTTEMEIIGRIIMDELVRGIIRDESRQELLDIIENHRAEIDGVILGCTELPLIIGSKDTDLKLLDTSDLHAEAALEYSLGE